MDELKELEDLSVWYSHQFVQNETITLDLGTTKDTSHRFERTKILEGSITGTIYRGSTVVQTMTVYENGKVKPTDIGSPKVKVVGGNMNYTTGELVLHWNEAPGSCHVVASYEYNMDASVVASYKHNMDASWAPKKKEDKSFEKPTFENFFTTEELADIARTAGTVAIWDFNSCLGDTIKEKYESLYIKCHELTAVLMRKGAAGYFWICCSPEIGSIFETACYGFWPAPYDKNNSDPDLGIAPLGVPELRYRGAVNHKWRLYTDTDMPSDMLLIGCNDKREDPRHYARLSVANFII
jgi:hypothetical protein